MLDVNPKKFPLSTFHYRVGLVLSFFSNRRNRDSHNPSPAGECAPPPPVLGEGNTRWRERGWESPNSDEGTYIVVLFIYTYFVPQTKETNFGKIDRKSILIAIPMAIRVSQYRMLSYLFCSHILFVCLQLVEVYIKRNNFFCS
jgi:hypothetical protein